MLQPTRRESHVQMFKWVRERGARFMLIKKMYSHFFPIVYLVDIVTLQLTSVKKSLNCCINVVLGRKHVDCLLLGVLLDKTFLHVWNCIKDDFSCLKNAVKWVLVPVFHNLNSKILSQGQIFHQLRRTCLSGTKYAMKVNYLIKNCICLFIQIFTQT